FAQPCRTRSWRSAGRMGTSAKSATEQPSPACTRHVFRTPQRACHSRDRTERSPAVRCRTYGTPLRPSSDPPPGPLPQRPPGFPQDKPLLSDPAHRIGGAFDRHRWRWPLSLEWRAARGPPRTSGTSLPRANAACQRSDSSSCSGDGSVPVSARRAVVEFPGPLVSEGHLDLSGQLHFCLALPTLPRREITVVSDELHRLAE